MNIQSIYWLMLIKLCRFLSTTGFDSLAWKIARITGLKARIDALLEEDITQ